MVNPPEVPRGKLDEAALGRWFTNFSVWSKETAKRMAALEAAAGVTTEAVEVDDGTGFDSYRHAPGNSGLTQYYIAGHAAMNYSGATASPAANQLYALPFVAPKRGGTLSLVGWRSTGTTGNGRIGVYSNKAPDNLYPDALLADSGTIAQTNAIKSASVSLTLEPGELYWLAYFASGVNNVHIIDPTFPAVAPLLGTTFTQDINVAIKVAQAFGTPPGTFPAGGALLTAAASEAPALGYQVSA